MTAEPLPTSSWPVPPPDGYTADDLDRIPDLPPHTELIDGSLVFVSPQKYFHSMAVDLLVMNLRQQVPEELRACREMSVVLNGRNRPEPDVMILRAEAVTEEAEETGFRAEDVVLAAEVVSPDSEERDRKRKPQLYAEAGIPHFWRIEKGTGRRPVVYVFELEPATRGYVPTGIHHDRLKLTVPFDIDIDLTAIDRL
ncbi:Uma2 family endonuclease [Streptomyces pini]|uniref:Endonuclease, Uma2 family (Restriction endonuclease fold) n=1 Tax=Streptomyces pini TaxID=1520580 RepID=A0A1I4GB96_9ACTN|nr:Uma2 family endonuclease [Streptomyces pini]SFL26386.1 Endonuclease, Uma2 family (restriction endonuclease fold) [Streptomyces pini]